MSRQLVICVFSLAHTSGRRSIQVDSGSANSVKAIARQAMKNTTTKPAETTGGTPRRSRRVASGPNIRPMMTDRKTGARKKRPNFRATTKPSMPRKTSAILADVFSIVSRFGVGGRRRPGRCRVTSISGSRVTGMNVPDPVSFRGRRMRAAACVYISLVGAI